MIDWLEPDALEVYRQLASDGDTAADTMRKAHAAALHVRLVQLYAKVLLPNPRGLEALHKLLKESDR
ncbi:hypothetical protein GCM10009578_092000 [Streptomyces rhizosphaericus]|uniref:hypothetical protein n=1 Tax=Streptomyces rhizosphaericus TaxID=114699 RepID=UPI0031D4902A